ncbi:RHS repeat-associated core domain-containing protein [Myroides odoratimimus]|uniref:RHS repeat domain-containing protein n=1 Tax=Myroides odoratimimus TaxID=76832 RepID=UPI0031014AB4
MRLSYSDANKNNTIESNEIIEETNYYPFGLTHKGYNQKNDGLMKDYKYQYNGKEKQEELGLNYYDYGARNYDAAIGRWMNMDPLAEKYMSFTPYTYVGN